VDRAGDQEALHLSPAEVVDVGVPVLVVAFARVEVLVERGAVEAREAVRVGREVRRHPVDEDADPGAVAGVDEAGEALGRAEARARREQRERLVAPGAGERVLGDGQHLDMGEAHVLHVGHEPLGQVVPARKAGGVVGGRAQPGAGVDLVDGDRRAGALAFRARRHPILVAPGKRNTVGDHGGGRGWGLGLAGEGIGL
jgi:hypothetical protein